jgi:hypothetical protein
MFVRACHNFSLHNGLVGYDGKIWLGSNLALQSSVFVALHSSAIGGHTRAPATYQRIHQLFHWPTMKIDILQWV